MCVCVYAWCVVGSQDAQAIKLDWPLWCHTRAADMLLVAPVREEIVFRGVMFSLFYKRARPASGPASATVKAECSLVG